MIQPPHALVLSPSATHPQDYGNRNRVWQVTSFLKKLGYSVDFVLYPFEAEWNERIPPEADLMRLAWDSFWIVPPGMALHSQAQGDYHHIDEWWDESIGNFLKWLFARRSYDLFVVNYTFLSKALTYAPKSTVRVLETHDVFTGRKEMLAALGVRPEFFYTTEDQERIAFDRADIVIAIKDSEAALIQGMTDKEVVSVPFFPSPSKLAAHRDTGFSGLSVGFIGALNSVNSANFQSFLREFDPMVRIYCPPLRLIVAGNVCQRLQTDNPAFELLGRVPDVEDFYAKIDVVVAPMIHSTGLKIKVAEALDYGKGVVSTTNGFDGFPAMDPMHSLESMRDVSRALIKLSFDRERREELIHRSQMAARLAKQSTSMAFRGVAEILQNRSKRIVFITDEPYWARASFRAARLGQWAQLCGFQARVIACYLVPPEAAEPAGSFDRLPDTLEFDVSRVQDPADVAALASALDEQLRRVGRTEIMMSVDRYWAGRLYAELVARGHFPIVDLWCDSLADAARDAGARPGDDFWISGAASEETESFEATPFRFAPPGLEDWAERPIGRRVLAICNASGRDAKEAETELRLAMAGRDVALDLVTVNDDADGVETLYAKLQTAERPLILVLVAPSARLKQACCALGTIGGVPFIGIDHDSFPLALSDRQGNIRMLRSCFELIDGILALLDAGIRPCLSSNALDTGWSHFWAILEGRLRAKRSAPGAGPGRPDADPVDGAIAVEAVAL